MYRVELKGFWENLLHGPHHVPNVPCGVESRNTVYKLPPPIMFLMYRVELKDAYGVVDIDGNTLVPNVPRGVERRANPCLHCGGHRVPNVPCGVERRKHNQNPLLQAWAFLMYRVELKEGTMD